MLRSLRSSGPGGQENFHQHLQLEACQWTWIKRISINSTRRLVGSYGSGGSPSPVDLLVEVVEQENSHHHHHLETYCTEEASHLGLQGGRRKEEQEGSKSPHGHRQGAAGDAVRTFARRWHFYSVAGGTVNGFSKSAENPENKRQNKEISSLSHTRTHTQAGNSLNTNSSADPTASQSDSYTLMTMECLTHLSWKTSGATRN